MIDTITRNPTALTGEITVQQRMAVDRERWTSRTSVYYFTCGADLGAGSEQLKALAASGLLLRVRGLLPDHRMAFDQALAVGQSGPSGITACIGHAVSGFLVEGPSAASDASGHNTLHPDVGCGEEVSVIVGDGSEVRAIACCLFDEETCAGMKRLVPGPGDCRNGRSFLAQTGSDPALFAVARSLQVPLIFVYGTLRRGEARHDQILKHGGVWVGSGRAPGRLHDHGAFPGMVPEQGTMTFGEVYRFDDIEPALKWLDIIEGFRGYGRSGSLFRRTLMDVQDPMGETMLCWAYAILEPKGDLIASGDWIKHRRGVNS